MNRLELARAIINKNEAPQKSDDAVQRPTHLFYPGLTRQPFFEADAFPWVAELRNSYQRISRELSETLERRRGFETIFPHYTEAGQWAALWFYMYGRRFDANCEAFPETLSILDGIPRAAGWMCYSAMSPGSHVKAHCGPTNAKLRLHFSIRSEPGSRMRVADKIYEWTPGDIMIFDDLYEHEVWVGGASPRIVLIVDVYHPELTDEEVDLLKDFETQPSPLLGNDSLRKIYERTTESFAGGEQGRSLDWLYGRSHL